MITNVTDLNMATEICTPTGYLIETTHKVGDTFWRMRNNRPTLYKIIKIIIHIEKDFDNSINIIEQYRTSYLPKNASSWYGEEEMIKASETLYQTKEALLNSFLD